MSTKLFIEAIDMELQGLAESYDIDDILPVMCDIIVERSEVCHNSSVIWCVNESSECIAKAIRYGVRVDSRIGRHGDNCEYSSNLMADILQRIADSGDRKAIFRVYLYTILKSINIGDYSLSLDINEYIEKGNLCNKLIMPIDNKMKICAEMAIKRLDSNALVNCIKDIVRDLRDNTVIFNLKLC